MKIKTTSFIEHQSSAKQNILSEAGENIRLLAPGAGCSCWGHSSCSCCSWGAALIPVNNNADQSEKDMPVLMDLSDPLQAASF